MPDAPDEDVGVTRGPLGTLETVRKGGGVGPRPTLALHDGVIPLDDLLHLMAVAVCGESESIEPEELLKMVRSMEELLEMVPPTRLFQVFGRDKLRERFAGREPDLQKIEEVLAALPRGAQTPDDERIAGKFKLLYPNKEMEYKDEVDEWIASGELKIRKRSTRSVYNLIDYKNRWYGEPVVLVDDDLRGFLNKRGIELLICNGQAENLKSIQDEEPANVRMQVQWSLTKPSISKGYNGALYDLLKAAHDAGQDRPTAGDVVDAWREQPPCSKIEVAEGEVKYRTNDGQVKLANRKAIGQAIRRMTRKNDIAGNV